MTDQGYLGQVIHQRPQAVGALEGEGVGVSAPAQG